MVFEGTCLCVCVSLFTTTNCLYSRICKKQRFCRKNLQICALRKLWWILRLCTKASQLLPPCGDVVRTRDIDDDMMVMTINKVRWGCKKYTLQNNFWNTLRNNIYLCCGVTKVSHIYLMCIVWMCMCIETWFEVIQKLVWQVRHEDGTQEGTYGWVDPNGVLR